jgi:hypothetical protein
VRSGNGMTLVRHPEGGHLVLPSPAALGLLIGLFPIALQQLTTLGFGLERISGGSGARARSTRFGMV